MRTIFIGCLVILFLSVTVRCQAQFTATTDIVGNENWTSAAAWSFPAGFAPNESYPNNDFDEDASTAAANGDYGLHIIIDANDEITIPNNVVIDLRNSSISTITIRAGAHLHFASNARLRLPSGARIILETGAIVEADNNSAGSLIEIGGNGVWGRACGGCTNGDLTGPGFLDEDSPPGDPLPVTIVFFNASLSEDGVQLEWATSMEKAFQKFIIQRSQDGINYANIGEVVGNNRDLVNVISSYDFEDKNPLIGFNYYRLQALDLDVQSETFEPIVIRVNASKSLSVFPNPTTGKELHVTLNFNPSDVDILVLIDSRGNELHRSRGSELDTQLTLTDDLKPGVYFLRFISGAGDFEQTARVLIK
jgi:hypothetical protein